MSSNCCSAFCCLPASILNMGGRVIFKMQFRSCILVASNPLEAAKKNNPSSILHVKKDRKEERDSTFKLGMFSLERVLTKELFSKGLEEGGGGRRITANGSLAQASK